MLFSYSISGDKQASGITDLETALQIYASCETANLWCKHSDGTLEEVASKFLGEEEGDAGHDSLTEEDFYL